MSKKSDKDCIFGGNEYMNNLQAEAFAQYPFFTFIQSLTSEDRKRVLYGDRHWFVYADYNWPQITYAMKCFLLTFSDTVEIQRATLLIQVWNAIPKYLEHFATFHPDIMSTEYPQFEFMDQLLTCRHECTTYHQLKESDKLPDEYYFSVDLGFVTKSKNITFGHITSNSWARIIQVVKVLEDMYWPDVDIDGILKIIKENNAKGGARYYNITNDKFVNTSTAQRMIHESEQYKVVAAEEDTDLFHYIIELLRKPSLRDEIDMPLFERRIIDLVEPDEDQPMVNVGALKKYTGDDTVFARLLSTSSETTVDIGAIETTEDAIIMCKVTEEAEETIKELQKKRKQIPTKIRQLTWRKYIGDSMNGNCWCCAGVITFEQWHAGHVVPASKGGPDKVDNLRPLCSSCNLSMGNSHMGDFIRRYGLKGCGATEFHNQSSETEFEDPIEVTAEVIALTAELAKLKV